MSKGFKVTKAEVKKVKFYLAIAILSFEAEKLISWILTNRIGLPNLVGFILFTLFAVHAVITLVLIHDLLFVSKRRDKNLWLFLLVSLPVFNLLLYRITMRRGKPYLGSYRYYSFG